MSAHARPLPQAPNDATQVPALAWDLTGARMPNRPRMRWSDVPGYRQVRALFQIAFGLWIWAITDRVFAQASQLPNPGDSVTTYLNATPAGDVSVAIFIALLGNIFANPFTSVGAPTTLLGEMFLVFNTFVLSVGVIWATYGLGTAVVQTAHEGQFMGKRLSQIWMPVRMTAGIAGLIPSFGGFSLSQAILLFAMSIGIGGANLAYRAMIDATNGMKSVVAPTLVSPRASGASLVDATYALFRARVCFRAMEDYGKLTAAIAPLAPEDRILRLVTSGGSVVNSVSYGTLLAPAACGGVSITANGTWTRDSSSAVGFRVASVNYDGIAQTMIQRARANFGPLSTSVEQLADRWYDDFQRFDTTKNSVRPAMPYAALQGLATGFYSGTNGQAATAQQQGALTASAIAEMRKFGWFGAGAWDATIGEVNAAVMQAAQAVTFVVTKPTGGERLNNSVWQSVATALENADQTALSGPAGGSIMGASSPGSALCDFVVFGMSFMKSTPTGNCSWGQNLVMTLIDYSTAGAGGATDAKNGLRIVDPIVAMKNMGDFLMTGAAAMFVAKAEFDAFAGDGAGGGLGSIGSSKIAGALTGAAGGLAKVSPIGTVMTALMAPIKALGPLLPTLIGAMFVVGAVMAIWLPLVPFVNWMGGLVQYFIICFTGLAAAPIWSFVHLDANGEGMGQRTETGYLFIINALFRPILMLIGFVGSKALMIGMGSFLFWIFPGAIANVQGNSVTGLASVLGLLVIFWIMMHTLVSHISALSVQLPDEALAWAGRAVGTSMGKEAEASNRAIFMTMGRFGQQALGASSAGRANRPGDADTSNRAAIAATRANSTGAKE